MSIGWWSPFQTPLIKALVEKRVEPLAGVYILFEKRPGTRWTMCAVGKSENLKEDLLALAGGEAPADVERGFSWIEVTTHGEREGVEAFLCLALSGGPGLGEPGGEPIKVALPPVPPTAAPTSRF